VVLFGLLLWALAAITYGTLRLSFGQRPAYIHVRWAPDVDAGARQQLEQRYQLTAGEFREKQTWAYMLLDPSRDNIRALVSDGAVEDTHEIDRAAFRVSFFSNRAPYGTAYVWIPPGLEVLIAVLLGMGAVAVGLAGLEVLAPSAISGPVRMLHAAFVALSTQSIWWWLAWCGVLVAIPVFAAHLRLQSVALILGGAAVLAGARAVTERQRRAVAVATLLLVGVIAVTRPIDPALVAMGDSEEHADSRANFERHFGGPVRFERHLMHVIVHRIYLLMDNTEEAARRAIVAMSRLGTVWFVLSALAIGLLERWSPAVLRYLGLALLAPATLLYFGWWEFGYLALSVAAFPLLYHGLRDGGWRLEAGSVLAGFGAALHGFGLLSILGAWIAALTMPAPLIDRIGRLGRIAAWGTAAYLGWIAIEVIAFNVALEPGPAGAIPWRPWLINEVRDQRLAVAFFSAPTARDIFMTGWVVGAPLLIVATSLRRQCAAELRLALWYSLPAILFEMFRWPVQGLGRGMDLIVAAFPALYALAWVCAQDRKGTRVAAALLISAHLAFWHIVHDPQFVNQLVD
jgi:hypothetical protein